MAALATLLLSPARAEPLHVHVVLGERGGAYEEFWEALRGELKSSALDLSLGEAGEPMGKADLVVAAGTRAASLFRGSRVPVLNVLVPKAGYDALAKPSAHSSAIYFDQPIERQLSLVSSTVPKARRLGVLYAAPPPGLDTLRRLAAERKLQLHEESVGDGQSLSDALDNVLQRSEVLLVLPDAAIYNSGTIRNILLTSYRREVPLVGISPAYVRAGALCAVYSTPAQIARQTAEAVRAFADTRTLPPSQYPREFEVAVNAQVARSLEVPIKDAEQLRRAIRRSP